MAHEDLVEDLLRDILNELRELRTTLATRNGHWGTGPVDPPDGPQLDLAPEIDPSSDLTDKDAAADVVADAAEPHAEATGDSAAADRGGEDAPPGATVIDWLAARGIETRQHHQFSEADEVYDWLADFLGSRFDTLQPLHTVIRSRLGTTGRFWLSLRDASQDQITNTTNFCHRLLELAFLNSYRYQKSDRQIHGQVNLAPKVINFFNGGWFERFIYLEIQEILIAQDVAWDYLRNAQIVWPSGNQFELDLLYLVDGHPLWVEAKTGDYQQYVEKYQNARQGLGVPVGRALLALLSVNADVASRLDRLYDLRVVNLSSLVPAVTAALNGT